MAYSKFTKKSVTKEVGTNHLMTARRAFSGTPDSVQFYELEPAVVLDIIRDENHPVFKDKKTCPKITELEWPKGYNDKEKPDYSWIGRIKARAIVSQNKAPLNELTWILPLETGIKEYPLLNETVVIVKYINNIYYTRRINSRNFLNNSADFRTEPRFGAGNRPNKTNCPNLVGARNPSNISPASNQYGVFLGKYFKANNKVRPLKHFEGDTIIESRFGSSIRFGCYEDDPKIDIGTNQGNGDDYSGNLGNPMILIRNRQRPKRGEESTFSHTIMEDINADGSSIHITSGKTIQKFAPTLVGPKPKPNEKPKKEPKNFAGLSKLSSSSVGTGQVPGPGNVSPSPTQMGQVSAAPLNSMNASSAGGSVGPSAAASKAKSGDWAGSIGASMGSAVGEKDGTAIGERLGNMGMANASKLVNVEGVSPNPRMGANISGSIGTTGVSSSSNAYHSINSKQGKSKFIKGIGVGNFSLNSTYESGIEGALGKARSVGKSTLLNKTKAGRALSAANSLGIDVDGVRDLGINPEDSPMFKIFKLASFGLKSICASLKNKKGFGSKTEESLGWMLSFGINLELLALLMAIFNRLRNLKFNFGAMFGFDLDKFTFDLCDWVNQVEFGNSLTDTLKGEATKLVDPLDPRAKVKAVGDDFSSKGILNPFARNNPDFKQQYSAIITEEEKAKLKAAGASFGSMGLSLNKGSEQVATMGFDPISGLFRQKEAGASTQLNFSKANVASVNVAKNAGAIDYTSFGEGVSFNTGVGIGGTALSGIGSISQDSSQSSSANSTNQQNQPQRNQVQQNQTQPISQPSTPNNRIGQTSTGSSGSSQTQPTSSSSSSTSTPSNVSSKPTTTRPSAGEQKSANENPNSVNSFHTGQPITRNDIKGTPIENADLNAVALLHPEDYKTLTDKKAVNQSIKQAQQARQNTFNAEMEKVETEAMEQAGGNLMFGKQLPELSGNQIIINSERVMFSSKTGEMVTFAKGKLGFATDSEMTLNAVERIVTTTSQHTSVVSPTIHLGAYTTTRHPVLKGDVATAWLSSLCGWLSSHVHNDPYITTGSPAQQGQLAGLRARLPTLHSTRVWIDG